MDKRINRPPQRGFTMLELVVVMSIVAILMAIAIPSYRYVTNGNRIAAEINGLLRRPDVRETLGKQGLAATGGTPEQLAQMTSSDMERWAKVVQAAKIGAD